jgi:hypothetical protein
MFAAVVFSIPPSSPEIYRHALEKTLNPIGTVAAYAFAAQGTG